MLVSPGTLAAVRRIRVANLFSVQFSCMGRGGGDGSQELGGIAVQRAAHCRPHVVENRTMTSNMMSSPPSQSRALGLPEESGACATVICGVQRGKGVMAVKRVRIGGRWRARIDKR